MINPSNAKELFLPLGERLFYYESGKYIAAAQKFIDYLGDQSYYIPINIINEIGALANLIDTEDLCKEAAAYLLRVKSILKNLQDTQTELIQYAQVNPENDLNEFVAVTEERKVELRKKHHEELIQYKKLLEGLIKSRKNTLAAKINNTPTISNDVKIEIKFPEDFSVTRLQKHFDPILSIEQAGLFLIYLSENKLIPNYTDSNLGKIAELLFARHNGRVRKSVSGLRYKKTKSNLLELRETINKIISSINDDLKSLKR
ncbi:MAG: hypothetical protein ACTHMD_05990 [Flavisolibacter sp.]